VLAGIDAARHGAVHGAVLLPDHGLVVERDHESMIGWAEITSGRHLAAEAGCRDDREWQFGKPIALSAGLRVPSAA
jgi:hypothetical protein